MTPSRQDDHVEPVGDADNTTESLVKQWGFAVTSEGHWIWSDKMLKGHAVVLEQGRYVHANRLLWRRRYVDLPGRARLKRLCDAGACVRPEHHVLASPRETMLRYGRNMEELRALEALLKFKATQFPSTRLSWEPGEWALDPRIARDLSVSTGSPLWVVQAAYSKLAQRALAAGPGRTKKRAAHEESERCAQAARDLIREETDTTVTTDTPMEGRRWLPPA